MSEVKEGKIFVGETRKYRVHSTGEVVGWPGRISFSGLCPVSLDRLSNIGKL